MDSKVTICIGLNDKDTKRQEITTEAAKALIFQAVVNYFGFGTITETTGIYKHSDGSNTIVVETTIKIELTFFDTDSDGAKAAVLPFASEMKGRLNQESIYFDIVPCSASLV